MKKSKILKTFLNFFISSIGNKGDRTIIKLNEFLKSKLIIFSIILYY